MEAAVIVTHEIFRCSNIIHIIVESREAMRDTNRHPLFGFHLFPFFLGYIQFYVCRLKYILVHEVVTVINHPAEVLQLLLTINKVWTFLGAFTTIEEGLGILDVNTRWLRNAIL